MEETTSDPLDDQMWRPMITERRWNWFVSGLVNLVFIFILALVFWWIFVHPGMPEFIGPRWFDALASVVAGWGILAVVVQIWFDHWPYSKYKDFFSHFFWGTLINLLIIIIVFIFFWFIVGPFIIPVFSPFALMAIPGSVYASSPELALFLSASAMGTILSCGFSFASIWAAGGTYWPFTELEPKKRGFAVLLMGTVITALTWGILYWPFQQVIALPPTYTLLEWNTWVAPPIWALFDPIDSLFNAGAQLSLSLTQWIILFGLLTMMVYEYSPWTALKKQPWIGIAALLGSTILGTIFALWVMPTILRFIPTVSWFPFLGQIVLSTWFAVHTIVGIFIWTQYFDNWPHKYSKFVNNVIRTIIVFVIGIISFFVYSLIAFFAFGDSIVWFAQQPVYWLLWLLWFMLLQVYVWKRAPAWKSV